METIWIDALEFEDYGGFICETQFVREMGQGYLLADGIGEPVKPATTRFCVEKDGWYRFFVRTKNWNIGHDPDGIVIAVDGEKSKHICGIMQVQQWYFEVGADFYLKEGEHILSVHDTKGWFGRFAAVVITSDYDFTPSPEICCMKRQRAEIKGLDITVTNHGHFDLLIAGAGVAGVTAAVAAARHGLTVALINDRPVLGGNGSVEGNVTLEGAAHRGFHESGIVYEMKNVRHEEKITWSDTFARFIAKEINIKLFLNMLVDNAECNGKCIRSVHAVDTVNLTEHVFTADNYIDATGDGWLGYYAGAAYHMGRESKIQYKESFAPICPDGNTMSGCNTRIVTDGGDTVCSYFAEYNTEEEVFNPPSWAFKLPYEEDISRTPKLIDRGEWWLENRNDYDDLWEAELSRDTLIRISLGYFDWLKNSWSERAKTRNLKLKSVGTFLAKRETRRLIGDYILTQNDYENNSQFADAVCYSGWNIDVHHVKGIFSGEESAFDLNKEVPITPIPFRCLYSKNVENLMMIGRCISVSHIGLGPTRVQLTGATMGQAVGTAAYLCKKYDLSPRNVGQEHMDELQQMLIKDGQYIPGCFNHDSEDLARSAVVTADSYMPGGEPENVINGQTRATDGKSYAWISKEKMPQRLILTLKEPTIISQVRITLEMPFERYPQGYLPMPSLDETLSDFTVEILEDDNWKCVGAIKNNYQRLVVIDFLPVEASAVRIHAKKAVRIDKAIIVEVRIY